MRFILIWCKSPRRRKPMTWGEAQEVKPRQLPAWQEARLFLTHLPGLCPLPRSLTLEALIGRPDTPAYGSQQPHRTCGLYSPLYEDHMLSPHYNSCGLFPVGRTFVHFIWSQPTFLWTLGATSLPPQLGYIYSSWPGILVPRDSCGARLPVNNPLCDSF